MKQILVFVMLSGLLCWLMFAPIYRHVLIMRQAALQQEVDYLLEIGANGSHGYIDAAMVEASRQRLMDKGFNGERLVYIVRSNTGQAADSPDAPLPRGSGLELTIRYPIEDLFVIDRLIGITQPDENTMIQASGVKMSEYIPY